MPAKVKVVLTDYVWESLDVEKKTLEGLADLVPLQTKKPEEFIAQAADCDALLNTYAGPITADHVRAEPVVPLQVLRGRAAGVLPDLRHFAPALRHVDRAAKVVLFPEVVQLPQHPRRAVVRRMRRHLALHASVVGVVELLDQRALALEESLAPRLVEFVDAVADLERQRVGAVLSEPEAHAGLRHRPGIADDMPERLDERRRA